MISTIQNVKNYKTNDPVSSMNALQGKKKRDYRFKIT